MIAVVFTPLLGASRLTLGLFAALSLGPLVAWATRQTRRGWRGWRECRRRREHRGRVRGTGRGNGSGDCDVVGGAADRRREMAALVRAPGAAHVTAHDRGRLRQRRGHPGAAARDRYRLPRRHRPRGRHRLDARRSDQRTVAVRDPAGRAPVAARRRHRAGCGPAVRRRRRGTGYLPHACQGARSSRRRRLRGRHLGYRRTRWLRGAAGGGAAWAPADGAATRRWCSYRPRQLRWRRAQLHRAGHVCQRAGALPRPERPSLAAHPDRPRALRDQCRWRRRRLRPRRLARPVRAVGRHHARPAVHEQRRRHVHPIAPPRPELRPDITATGRPWATWTATAGSISSSSAMAP